MTSVKPPTLFAALRKLHSHSWLAPAFGSVGGFVMLWSVPKYHQWAHAGAYLVAYSSLAALVATYLYPVVRDFSSATARLETVFDAIGLGVPLRRWHRGLRSTALIAVVGAFSLQILASVFREASPLLLTASQCFGLIATAVALVFIFVVWRIRRGLSRLRNKEASVSDVQPPKSARFILLLIPKRYRDHLIGDLEEEYTTIVLPGYGKQRAQIWYWWQVAAIVVPILWSQLKKILGLAWLWRHIQ